MTRTPWTELAMQMLRGEDVELPAIDWHITDDPARVEEMYRELRKRRRELDELYPFVLPDEEPDRQRGEE